MALAVVFMVLSAPRLLWATDPLCATVRLQVNQEASFERQAFDATLKINNPLETLAIEQIGVSVLFYDQDGNTVRASSDPNDLAALFFITVDALDGINDVSGNGRVAPRSAGEIHWLIIPAPGAGGATAAGTPYVIGARIDYSVNGQTNSFAAMPDTIIVKPTPLLTLDYFLPDNVYGDDAFTAMIEPPIPFHLGVRVRNSGDGAAHNMQLASAQPKIVENELGLLIGFQITGTSVNDAPAALTLHAQLGTIAPRTTVIARWIMETSLSGRFTAFSAYCTHADELGGRLTALISNVATHVLVHDVQVDLPGRDGVRDFLADDGVYRVYESDGSDTVVVDRSAAASCSGPGGSGLIRFYTITMPATTGPAYVGKPVSSCDQRRVISAMRSDGKTLLSANVWLSKTRTGSGPWQHYLNLFDINAGGTYTIAVEDIAGLPQAPVQEYIADPKLGQVGRAMGFMVHASDMNGRLESLAALPLPTHAEYRTTVNGALGEGIFLWTPQAGQAGLHRVTFSASDGELSDAQTVTIIVGDAGETTNQHGNLPSQQIERFVVSRDATLVGAQQNTFHARGGEPASTNLRVQCLAAPQPRYTSAAQLLAMADAGTNSYPPPSTNGLVMSVADGTDAVGYYVPAPAFEYRTRSVWMGMDAAQTWASDAGEPGFVAAYIGATNDDYYGWLRAFSAEEITNAAYYGDTCQPDARLITPNQLNCAWTPANPCINIVNPAYQIPYLTLPGCAQGLVTGHVVALAGGSNNVLAAEWLVVEYQLQGATDWQVMTTSVNAHGAFAGAVSAPAYPTNVWLRVRVADAHTPTPGLPVSAVVALNVIPELCAGAALMVFVIACAARARPRNPGRPAR
jgi:hypothetical protein